MSDVFSHRPVLLNELVTALSPAPGGRYIDGTFGRGGHSRALLTQLDAAARLLVLDKDPQAIQAAELFATEDVRVIVRQGSFSQLDEFVSEMGWSGAVNGVMLDLGVSSPQLDDADRGFSFSRDGELDMRMDTGSGVSAAQWLKTVKEADLARVFKEYGEERFAKRIARAIVAARTDTPITRTRQLAQIIAQANPAWERNKDPATRCFQAIRIFINSELSDLQQGLEKAVECLAIGGRLAVISFHSLEDRIVKRYFRDQSRGDDFPPGLPVTQAQLNPRLRLIGKAMRPNPIEVDENPRARSAVLRVVEKL